jgi:hypothetical protein
LTWSPNALKLIVEGSTVNLKPSYYDSISTGFHAVRILMLVPSIITLISPFLCFFKSPI